MSKVMKNTEYELDINPDNLCRVCLSQDLPLKCIFFSEIIDGKIVNFPDVLANVLDIRIDQTLFPDKICANCRKKIQEFYVFKQKSLVNDRLLKQLYGPEVVQEDIEEERLPVQQDDEECAPREMEQEENEVWRGKIECDEKILLTCSECDTVFETTEELLEHEETCNNASLQCYYCYEVFSGEDELQQHTEKHHRVEVEEVIEAPWNQEQEESRSQGKTCEDEEVVMKDIEECDEVTDTSNHIYHCFLCQMKFPDQGADEQHINFHRRTFPEIISSIPMFKCSRCFLMFLYKGDLQNHLAKGCTGARSTNDHVIWTDTRYLDDSEAGLRKIVSLEEIENSNLKCEYCEQEFKCLDTVVDHTKSCHTDMLKNSEERPHQCGICHDVMNSEKAARQHLYLDHCKSFDCFINNCDKSYQTSSKLFQHQLRFHSGDNQLSCTHCFSSFPSNAHLVLHLKTECPGLIYDCSMCNKRFLTAQGKKQHEFIHKNIKQYECSLCDKRYRSRIELITHTRLHTGERPYSCSLCHKTFRTLSNKKDHMSTHTQERNYRCDICKAFFKSERILRGHQKIHQDTKVFKCTECGKAFRRKQHLETHTKTHMKKFN
ncbi:zinc finger protein 425 [Sergentomyia squamirostris]